MSRFRAWSMVVVAHFVVSVKVTLTAVFDLSSAHVSRSTSIAAAVGKLPCKRYSRYSPISYLKYSPHTPNSMFNQITGSVCNTFWFNSRFVHRADRSVLSRALRVVSYN